MIVTSNSRSTCKIICVTFRRVGQVEGSYGYDSGSGKTGTADKWKPYGPKFGTGDVIGCGVIYDGAQGIQFNTL